MKRKGNSNAKTLPLTKSARLKRDAMAWRVLGINPKSAVKRKRRK